MIHHRPRFARPRKTRLALCLAVAPLIALATASAAQIVSQRPIQPAPRPPAQVFTPNTVVDAGALPAKPADGVPAGTIAVSWDRKAWITSIDGKRSDIVFRLGSVHVIRGGGLEGIVSGWITGNRRMNGANKSETVGSVLTVLRQNGTEAVVRVTDISGGKVPWESLQEPKYASVKLLLRTGGGAREINALLHRSIYRCQRGEPNCS
jgi:hypothetical protein